MVSRTGVTSLLIKCNMTPNMLCGCVCYNAFLNKPSGINLLFIYMLHTGIVSQSYKFSPILITCEFSVSFSVIQQLLTKEKEG